MARLLLPPDATISCVFIYYYLLSENSNKSKSTVLFLCSIMCLQFMYLKGSVKPKVTDALRVFQSLPKH